jgi:hypothetical protein
MANGTIFTLLKPCGISMASARTLTHLRLVVRDVKAPLMVLAESIIVNEVADRELTDCYQ